MVCGRVQKKSSYGAMLRGAARRRGSVCVASFSAFGRCVVLCMWRLFSVALAFTNSVPTRIVPVQITTARRTLVDRAGSV